MSVSEDCELQELVKQTLEKSGSLSKIRAELRASVFLTLEENGCFQNSKVQNTNLQNFAKSTDGVLMICLVREFLEYFGLSFTASVFDPELASYGVHCDCNDRSKLSSQLNVSSSSDDSDRPLLGQMLKIIRSIQSTPKHQTINSDIMKKSSNFTNCKSSDTSTEYLPLQCTAHVNNEAELNKKPEIDEDENAALRTEHSRDFKRNSIQVTSDQEVDVSKYNLSSLDDLPPLPYSFTQTKSNTSSLNKFKQMNMLKAALKDTIADDDNSVATEDDENDVQDSSRLEESIAEESEITAEGGSS